IQAPVYDTICASQMTLKNAYEFRKLNESGLKKLAAELCGEPLPTFTDVTGGRHFDELDPEDKETIRYGAADSDFALRLYHKFNDWFDRFLPKHRYIVEEIESPTAVFVGLMKNNGVPMDIPAMVSAKEKAVKAIESLRVQIADMIGNVDIGSNCGTAALRDYFYDELRLPVLKRTDKHAPSMDDEALLLLQENCRRNRPDMVGLFDLIFEYRKWQKLKSTYLDGYIGNVNATTGRIHPDLMQLAADTGRFACRKPNLQNQVSPGQDPIGIRNFITAPNGWTLLEADYSQAEIRLCAYLSQDKVLLDAYRHGADVHAITTSAVFGIPIEEAMDHKNPEYKHRRTVAKGTMFGIMYGIGGAGLSRNLYTNAGI
ncbi:MAG: DNA polymerase, partial [Acutalibacteraceae bacterium]|nr:DNA polymerase [Acutalibacteraceae bacterium]